MIPLLLDGDKKQMRVAAKYRIGNVTHLFVKWAKDKAELEELTKWAQIVNVLDEMNQV